jgi:redox-sensitive bicupin YhaK (pirin superfamily)
VLDAGDAVRIETGANPARLLLLAAQPIGEPVVQHGPFVMNTQEEIEQALRDYRSGRLAT